MEQVNGIELKVLRIRARLPQYRVAQAIGISPQLLCHVENGRKAAAPELAAAIRQAIRQLAPQVDHEAGDDHAA